MKEDPPKNIDSAYWDYGEVSHVIWMNKAGGEDLAYVGLAVCALLHHLAEQKRADVETVR